MSSFSLSHRNHLRHSLVNQISLPLISVKLRLEYFGGISSYFSVVLRMNVIYLLQYLMEQIILKEFVLP